MVPVLSPPTVWPTGRCHFACVEPSPTWPNLNFYLSGEIYWPHSSDSLGPHPSQLQQCWAFSARSKQSVLALAALSWTTLGGGGVGPKRAAAGLSLLSAFC